MARKTNNAKTYAQTVLMTAGTTSLGAGVLSKGLPATYATYRKIRRNPTVAFARALAASPVISAEWSVKLKDGVGDSVAEFIQECVLPLRPSFIREAMYHGMIDYGWNPFEAIYGTKSYKGRQYTIVERLKPLLVDLTDILVVNPSGEFYGFQQAAPYGAHTTSGYIDIEAPNAVLVTSNSEGDNLYGEGYLENIRLSFTGWERCTIGAERFDMKQAGNLWVIHYPPGQSRSGSEMVDNETIAQRIIAALEASGSIAVPRQVNRTVKELNQQAGGNAWEIQLIDPTSKQATFIERQNYLDKMFVRGLLMPERMALEAEYGTRADAGVHANLALAIRENEHDDLTRQFNAQVVNPLLIENFGEEMDGQASVVASPLADEKLTFFRTLYTAILSSPFAGQESIEAIDTDALMDILDVPKAESVADINQPAAGGPGNTGLVTIKKELGLRLQEMIAGSKVRTEA